MSSPIQDYLDRLHQQLMPLQGGRVADYIPELAKADPADFGIAIATVDGRVYETGTTRKAFTIQSISKPLVYGVALEDQGPERVRQVVGVEPSGEAFNSINLEAGTGRPFNPMVNAGAIAIASLVAGSDAAARLERVVSALSTYAGRRLEVDEAVFASERATGHRNRAIGHLLRSHGILPGPPEPTLELYFKQCSLRVDCRDLALMAATLANGGVHPVSGEVAVRAEFVEPILSVMTTCGMYDYSGSWVHRIGLPAKSGVGGGIIAVLPGQLGIGVWSPRLDERGNSVRGVRVCETVSREMRLHSLSPPRTAATTVRARYDLAGVRSKRRRSAADGQRLDAHGGGTQVFELQGDLRFATLEPVLRDIIDRCAAASFIVLDFKRVGLVDAAAGRMLAALAAACAARGQQLVMTRVRRGDLLAGFDEALSPAALRAVSFQPQLDLGLEWCEQQTLRRHRPAPAGAAACTLEDHHLCAGASADDLQCLRGFLQFHGYEPGATIVRRGDPADALYFLLRGDVSVVVDLPQGGVQRLATLSTGMGFGEAAITVGGVRTADVRADSVVECATLDVRSFQQLQRERPTLALVLMRNLLIHSHRTAARLTREVSALEG